MTTEQLERERIINPIVPESVAHNARVTTLSLYPFVLTQRSQEALYLISFLSIIDI